MVSLLPSLLLAPNIHHCSTENATICLQPSERNGNPPTMTTAVSVFSTQKWKEMDDHEKGKHTLSNCTVLPKVQITAGGNSQCNAASQTYTTKEETIMRNDEEGSTQAEDTVRERLRFHSQE